MGASGSAVIPHKQEEEEMIRHSSLVDIIEVSLVA